MSDVGIQRALVTVSVRPRPMALYRIPVTLMLLGLFMMALQAGQPLFGLAMLMTAATTSLGCTWRNYGRRSSQVATLRGQGDAQLVEGRYGKARSLYERSLALAERELPPAAPQLLVNYYSLAAVNSMLHDHTKAGRYLDELLQGLEDRVPAPWSGHVAWLMRRVAHHHSLEGDHAEAERLCRRALDLVGDAPGADDNSVRSLLDDLAWVEHHAGRYTDAERHFRQALAVHEQFRDVALELSQRPRGGSERRGSPYREPGPATTSTSGGLDRAVAFTLLGLGWTIYERGRYDEARDCFERASMIAQRLLTVLASQSSSPHALEGLWVEVLRGQGAIALTRGDYAQGEAHYAEAQRSMPEASEAAPRAALLVDMSWLGRCRERYDCAEAKAREAEAVVEGAKDELATIASALHEGLADLRRRQGRAREGQRQIAQAYELAARCLGPEHPRMVGIFAISARLAVARSELVEAEGWARRSQALCSAGELGKEHPKMADACLAMGEVQLARGHFGAAENHLAQALRLREEALGAEHPELREILDAQLAVLRATSRSAEVEPLLDRLARLPVGGCEGEAEVGMGC